MSFEDERTSWKAKRIKDGLWVMAQSWMAEESTLLLVKCVGASTNSLVVWRSSIPQNGVVSNPRGAGITGKAAGQTCQTCRMDLDVASFSGHVWHLFQGIHFDQSSAFLSDFIFVHSSHLHYSSKDPWSLMIFSVSERSDGCLSAQLGSHTPVSQVDLVEVEGPIVFIHLYGAFWHNREAWFWKCVKTVWRWQIAGQRWPASKSAMDLRRSKSTHSS